MDRTTILKKEQRKITNFVKKDFSYNTIDIEDLVQEALIAFHEALGQFKKEISPNYFSFCYQRAKWRCIDYLRSQKMDQSVLSIELTYDREENSPLIEECRSKLSAVDDNIERLSDLNLLEKTMNNTPLKHRELLLYEFYGIKSEVEGRVYSKPSVIMIKRKFKQDFYNLRACS